MRTNQRHIPFVKKNINQIDTLSATDVTHITSSGKYDL